mgnify:CR=1 FL=1
MGDNSLPLTMKLTVTESLKHKPSAACETLALEKSLNIIHKLKVEDMAKEEALKSQLDKIFDDETCSRFFALLCELHYRGRITDEVSRITLAALSTIECALAFPTLSWDGASFLVKQAEPENYEAL